MVARIRSNFCQLRCFGKDWNRRGSEGKALLGKAAEGWFSSTGICWAPMWDHYGRKDQKELFCQYRMLWERLNRRESEEKALLEELLRNFCRYRMLMRL